jgi:hypothetical protein
LAWLGFVPDEVSCAPPVAVARLAERPGVVTLMELIGARVAGQDGSLLPPTDRTAAQQGESLHALRRDMGWKSEPIATMGEWWPASLVFDSVRVPQENVLGEVGKGFELAMRGHQVAHPVRRLAGAAGHGHPACLIQRRTIARNLLKGGARHGGIGEWRQRHALQVGEGGAGSSGAPRLTVSVDREMLSPPSAPTAKGGLPCPSATISGRRPGSGSWTRRSSR